MNPSRLLVPVSALIFSISVATVKTLPAQAIPANAPPSQGDEAAAKPDYSKEAFVVEKVYEHYRFENDGTGRKDLTMRVHIQSEAGVKAFGQLQLGYNSANERMEITLVKVTKPDGSAITAGSDAVQDLSGSVQRFAPVYTDYHEKHVTVPGLRPGDTLECQIATIFEPALTPGQFWTQHDFNVSDVVLDERFEIDVPADRKIKLKTKSGFDPKITEEGSRRIYRWTSSHLTPTADSSDKDKEKEKKPAPLE